MKIFANENLIVVKIYKRTVDVTLEIFKEYFHKLEEEDVAGNLVIINPDGVHIKRSKK